MIYGKLVVRPHRGGRRARCSYRNTYIRNGRLGTSLRPVPLPLPRPSPPLPKAKRLFDFLIGLTPIFVIFFFFASARFRSRIFWDFRRPSGTCSPPSPSDSTRPDHAWLGRTQCEVTVCVDVLDGQTGQVPVRCHQSVFSVTERISVRHLDRHGLWKTATPVRGVRNGRQGEVKTDEGDSDKTRGPNEGCGGDQDIRRQSYSGRR